MFFALSLILVFGILVSYPSLPRQSAPDIVQPIGFVNVSYPGVSPENISRLIAQPLEDKIQDIAELDILTSNVGIGILSVTAEFQTEADVDEMMALLREKVDLARAEFPEGVQEPSVSSLDFSEQPVMTLALISSSNRDIYDIYGFAQDIEKDIQDIRGIKDIDIQGKRDRHLRVDVSSAALSNYNLTASDISRQISASHVARPAGELYLGNSRVSIKMDQEIVTPEGLRAVPLNTQLQVGDIGSTGWYSEEPRDGVWAAARTEEGWDGGTAVLISITRVTGSNIVAISESVKEKLEDIKKQFPQDLNVFVVQDDAINTQDSLSTLEGSALTGLLIIFIVLMFFMNSRAAIIAGMAIPFSLGITFLAMLLTGATLNFMSLFALVMAVGILVDNAIVIVESIWSEARSGYSADEAAKRGLSRMALPVITSTGTTLSAFLPLALMTGLVGEFVRLLPITVMYCLIASLWVATFVTPFLAAFFMNTEVRTRSFFGRTVGRLQHGFQSWLSGIADTYQYWLSGVLASARKSFMVISVAWAAFFISISFFLSGLLPAVFFPNEDQSLLFVNITAPAGTRVDDTYARSLPVLEKIEELPELSQYSLSVGSLYASDASESRTGERYANITLQFVPISERSRGTDEISRELRDTFSSITGTYIEVVEMTGGPPAGRPINVRLVGENAIELRAVANRITGIMRDIPGLRNIDSGISLGGSEIILQVDPLAATTVGLTPNDVLSQIAAFFSGSVITQIDSMKDSYVYMQGSIPQRSDIGSLEGFLLLTASGQQVPLSSIARIELAPQETLITRIDGSRVVSVTSGVKDGYNANNLFTEIQNRIEAEKLAGTLAIPSSVTVEFTGENDDTAESFTSLGNASIVGASLIYLMLVAQFGSLTLPFAVLFSLPLALILIFPGLFVVGVDFSFTAFIGIVALLGIVVNDAIVLFDALISSKSKDPKVLARAARSRFMPVLSTSLTTVGGLLPLTLTEPTWGPMGYSIMFGLSCATVLILVVLPSMFVLVRAQAGWFFLALLVVALGIGAVGMALSSAMLPLFAFSIVSVASLFVLHFYGHHIIRLTQCLHDFFYSRIRFSFDHPSRDKDE